MAGVREAVKKYLAYIFILLGIVWVAIILTGGAALLLWPALTSILSGALLLLRPEMKFSRALAKASALYGVLLAGYQAYVAIPLLGSLFSTFGTYSAASFTVIALLYLAILYASFSSPGAKVEET
jgi:hypothetical protein